MSQDTKKIGGAGGRKKKRPPAVSKTKAKPTTKRSRNK